MEAFNQPWVQKTTWNLFLFQGNLFFFNGFIIFRLCYVFFREKGQCQVPYRWTIAEYFPTIGASRETWKNKNIPGELVGRWIGFCFGGVVIPRSSSLFGSPIFPPYESSGVPQGSTPETLGHPGTRKRTTTSGSDSWAPMVVILLWSNSNFKSLTGEFRLVNCLNTFFECAWYTRYKINIYI